jgi:hypothetical protein
MLLLLLWSGAVWWSSDFRLAETEMEQLRGGELELSAAAWSGTKGSSELAARAWR